LPRHGLSPTLRAVVEPGAATVARAKSHPVLRRFDLRRVRLPLGKTTVSLVLPDARDWFRRGEWADATERGAEPPYWVQVWPASLAIARWLVRRGSLAGQRVLDLGCGLGIPGLAAATVGADVTFADLEADALAFAGWNAAHVAAPERVHAVGLDWRSTTIAGTFDLVILADVTYRPIHHVAMKRQLAACLAPRGVILHADPNRHESLPFLQWLRTTYPALTAQKHTVALEGSVDVRVCAASPDAGALAPWAAALGAGTRIQQSDRGAAPAATPTANPPVPEPPHGPP
jgi:predicted nicotinamide N-methyase